MARKFKDMQTPEQQHADRRAQAMREQAARHEQQAKEAGADIRNTAWSGKNGVPPEEVLAVPRGHRAKAKALREQADRVAPQEAPKPKRRWF